MRFFVCSSCVRHVKVDETACPFCGAVANGPVPVRPARLLTIRDRTTLMFGAAMATALVAASATATGCEPAPVAMYGGPPVHEPTNDTPSNDAGANATPPDAAAHPPPPPVAIYGAPPTHSRD
jgi:hypothetical protein